MKETIAEASFIGITKTGHEFPLEVSVGKPKPSGNDWTCSVNVSNLLLDSRDICGVDSLQALLLGLRFAENLLREFIDSGGQLLDTESRGPVPLEAYFLKSRHDGA